MLAWACTVHKVQGQTLDQVVVNFDLEKQRSFKSGQMYVALSCVTSLNGLFLVGTYKPSAKVACALEMCYRKYQLFPV